MSEIKSRWQHLSDREKWAARGASFAAKLKATKAVWFTPGPVKGSKKAAAAGKNTTKRATRKATNAAKKI